MAEVIPQITIDSSKVKETWVQNEVVTNDVYNAINKAVIDLKDNNNLLDSNAMLFREEYNSSSKNLNNAIHQGVYSFTNSAVNAPSGVNGGNLLVTNTSKTNQGSSIITQIAFCHNGAVYARTKNTSENFTAWNKLAYITDNVASATKATQDSTGRNITEYLYKKEDLTLNGSTKILTVGNISEILNSFCTKFKNIQGTNSYAENPPTTIMELNNNKAPLNSPVLTGIPTAPTPSISTNNTQIATTAFVNSYAPSKKGTGASGTWNITANKAIADKNGLQIDTGYLKLSGGTVTGDLLAPTPSADDNSKKVATTEFVKSLFTKDTSVPGWSKNTVTGIVRQWGVITYNSSPNPQVITPPITFSTLLSCGATDVGWSKGTGNTFANMDFSGGKLYIRPVYGNDEAALNGVVLRWWIECLL